MKAVISTNGVEMFPESVGEEVLVDLLAGKSGHLSRKSTRDGGSLVLDLTNEQDREDTHHRTCAGEQPSKRAVLRKSRTKDRRPRRDKGVQ